MPAQGPLTGEPAALRLLVRATPGAAADRVGGTQAAPDGRLALKVAVTAVADRGRANTAIIRLLAKALDLAPSQIALQRGATDRLKVFAIAPISPQAAQALQARLAALTS